MLEVGGSAEAAPTFAGEHPRLPRRAHVLGVATRTQHPRRTLAARRNQQRGRDSPPAGTSGGGYSGEQRRGRRSTVGTGRFLDFVVFFLQNFVRNLSTKFLKNIFVMSNVLLRKFASEFCS